MLATKRFVRPSGKRFWRVSVALLAAVAALGFFEGPEVAAQTAKTEQADQAFLGVRVLKTADAGEIGWTADLASSCGQCRLLLSEHTSGQNGKEFFFHLWVPRAAASIGPIHLKLDSSKIRGILVSYTDTGLAERGWVRTEERANGVGAVPYRRVSDGVVFEIPAVLKGVSLPPDDLADVSQDYTFIETPGVYIRISHADKQRRRGAYASGIWPALEAKAALNLEFAAREAIRILHLDTALKDSGVANIMLMNFDTNYPTLGPNEAHDDWPPHWHMHLFWNEEPKVRKVGHFYIRPDGLLGQFMSDDWKSYQDRIRQKKWYGSGEADETRTPDGRLLYSHTITQEGWFRLASPLGSCLFRPISGGFDSGVSLSCGDERPPMQIRATDDTVGGRIQLFLNDRLVDDYRYDPDTGALLSTGSKAD